MKTLLTLSLAVLNVVFGVRVGSVSKEKEAATFFFTDSSNPVVCTSNEQEAATFSVLDNDNSSYANNEKEASTFFLSNSSLSFLEGLYESYSENE